MEQSQNPNYWKVMCNTLETENQSLRKKIKFVVRRIRHQNKKLKRISQASQDNQSLMDKKRNMNEEGESASVASLPPPRYPFEIIPEELWVIIMEDYIQDPGEILKMCQVSAQLNGIYEYTKWRLGFGKVFPSLMDYLDQRTLLNLRLINKKWKNVVDSLLESHHNSFTLCHNADLEKFEPAPGFYYPTWRREQGPMKIFGIPRIMQFLQQLENRPSQNAKRDDDGGNPFVGRAVHFSPRPANTDEMTILSGEIASAYWQHLLELLTQYGKHVYQLCISTGDVEMHSLVFYRHLRACLDLVPNLRSLMLEGLLRQPRSSYCELRLRIFRETHKLAELPHLKCVDVNTRLDLWVDRVDGIRSYHEEKHVVLNQLVLQTYAPQMETLFYRGKSLNPNSVTEYPQQLPNVKELNALCADSVGVMFLLREIRMPLVTTLRVFIPEGCYVLRELFLLLQKCPLLTRLELGETQLLLTDGLPQLEPAPSVRYLSVGHSVHTNYNYLICLPNLETLILCVPPMAPEVDFNGKKEKYNEIVKLEPYLDGEEDVYHSNIWLVLPRLQKVTVFDTPQGTWKCYTREIFQRDRMKM